MIAELHERNEPVPVQHGHVVVEIGRGVPAQEVIVVDADFAGRVMVADVVIVGLGQRYVNDAENQNADSQVRVPSPESPPIERHDLASFPMDHQLSSASSRRDRCRADAVLPHTNIMNQPHEPVKRRRGMSEHTWFAPIELGCHELHA